MAYKIQQINRGVKRRNYSKVSGNLSLPNLIEVQTETFNWFKQQGIQEVLDEFFPILSMDGTSVLTLENWGFKEPRISVRKAKEESKFMMHQFMQT